MKKFNKNLTGIVLAIALVVGFTGANTAHAALAPGFLGVATGYSVFGDAGISEAGTYTSDTLWGDIGINGVALTPSAEGEQVDTFHATDTSSLVVSATGAAHLALAPTEQPPTTTVDLSANNISVGPGVYTITGGGVFSKTLTLTGSGTYIFQYGGTIAQETGGTMILGPGATACNVYWYTPYDMTFADGGNFFGTISAGTKITFAAAATLQGRAWAGTYVALYDQTITEPTCTGNLTVTKEVVGGSKLPADFPLHVDTTLVTTGDVTAFTPGIYTITETNNSNYTSSFSGACNGSNSVTIASDDNLFCTITNTYHAPSRVSGSIPRVVVPVFQPSITILSTPVVIAPIIPKLPKTGFAPQESGMWYESLLNNILDLFR